MVWIDFHQQEWNHVPHQGNRHVVVVVRVFKLLYEVVYFFTFALLHTYNDTQISVLSFLCLHQIQCKHIFCLLTSLSVSL